jgi:hypothetical protein
VSAGFTEKSFLIRLSKTIAGCAFAIVSVASVGTGQSPVAPATPISNVVTYPTYISISLETVVDRPAAEVWKRVGKFCAIAEWWPVQLPCIILNGQDGELGSVRSAAGEVLVGKTELSYTYTQTVRPDRPYNLYHGTLEAKPMTATTSKLIYSVMYDNSMLADDTARNKEKTQRTATLTQALQNMKVLAEGGTLPPRPARGGGR